MMPSVIICFMVACTVSSIICRIEVCCSVSTMGAVDFANADALGHSPLVGVLARDPSDLFPRFGRRNGLGLVWMLLANRIRLCDREVYRQGSILTLISS